MQIIEGQLKIFVLFLHVYKKKNKLNALKNVNKTEKKRKKLNEMISKIENTNELKAISEKKH